MNRDNVIYSLTHSNISEPQTKEYRLMYFWGCWLTKSVLYAESDNEAIFDAKKDALDSIKKGFRAALWCDYKKVYEF